MTALAGRGSKFLQLLKSEKHTCPGSSRNIELFHMAPVFIKAVIAVSEYCTRKCSLWLFLNGDCKLGSRSIQMKSLVPSRLESTEIENSFRKESVSSRYSIKVLISSKVHGASTWKQLKQSCRNRGPQVSAWPLHCQAAVGLVTQWEQVAAPLPGLSRSSQRPHKMRSLNTGVE